jgi:hypothetical protein
MYEVTDGNATFEEDTREDAIERAHELSEGNQRTVVAENDIETLTYRDGELTQYLYNTRGRR